MYQADVDAIKRAAAGKWREIIATLGGVDPAILDGTHRACPKCGGTDRFRAFDDFAETGGLICNQCHSKHNSDGISALMWLCGWSFKNTMAQLARYLKIEPKRDGGRDGEVRNPLYDQICGSREGDRPLDTMLPGWCATKPPITPDAVRSLDPHYIRWPKKSRHALHCFGLPGRAIKGDDTELAAVLLYNLEGPEFPAFGSLGARKTHLVRGSKESWIWPGKVKDLQSAEVIVKVEGPSDLLALLSVGLPKGWIALTNCCGAKSSDPKKLDFTFAAGKLVVVVGDADKPGEDGAARFAAVFQRAGAREVRIPKLPYSVSDDHGKDLRDWLAEGHSTADLVALVEATAPWQPPPHAESKKARRGGEEEPSVAEILVTLAKAAGAELWHTPEGDAYVTVPVGKHREHYPVKSRMFRRWLARQYYLFNEQRVPGSQAIHDAVGMLEGEALFDGLEYPVFVRTAEADGNIYIDLCDSSWRAVELSPEGWRVIAVPPVRFRRAKAMLALPEPKHGGKVDQLRPFVNVRGDEWPLLAAWLLAAYRSRGPYPVLCLHGEHGSAKSTTARVLRSLVDPNTAPLRCEPREPRDLMIAASNGWVVALDNISHLPAWLSDALCRLSTGGGFSTRELYTDSEEVIFDAMRPLILNGIEEVATRSDLLDRSIMLSLPTIQEAGRQPESSLWRAFEKAAPFIFGAMLTAVCEAMRDISAVKLLQLPRMADFAMWAAAGEQGMGLQPGEFMAAYTTNREAGNELALEASPLAKVLLGFMEDLNTWTGTASDLLDALEKQVEDKVRRQRGWPQSARALSGAVKRLAPNLRKAGVDVEMNGHIGRGKAKRKAITLTRTDREICAPTSPTDPTAEKPGSKGGDGAANQVGGVANEVDGVAAGPQDLGDVNPCHTTPWVLGADGVDDFPPRSSGDQSGISAPEEVVEWTG